MAKRFDDNPELQAYTGTEVIPMQSVDGGTDTDENPVAADTDVKITLEALREFALRSPENVQTGTAYTLQLSDAFKLVAMANSSANTLTVPPASDVEFPVGTRIDISQDGTGQTTIAAGAGVTIRTPETMKLRKQWAKATLIKRATDTWDLEGNLEAAP